MYDEYISVDSPRLAPVGFFTGRNDIPRYLLNGNGNCRFAYVVVGHEQARALARGVGEAAENGRLGIDVAEQEDSSEDAANESDR